MKRENEEKEIRKIKRKKMHKTQRSTPFHLPIPPSKATRARLWKALATKDGCANLNLIRNGNFASVK